MSERALWCAVIIEAIRDLGDKHLSIRAAAKHWILSDVMEIGSFAWICSHLDLDETKIRNMSLTRHGRKLLLKNKAKPEVESYD
jgi:hypothetical protein